MDRPQRHLVAQSFLSFAVQVGVTPTPLNLSCSIQSLVTLIILSVPKASTAPVLLGDSSVAIAKSNGLEIVPGCPVQLEVRNERQLYELQIPMVEMMCKVPESIPFVVFDPSTIYLVSTAAQAIGCLLFKAAVL